MTENYSEDTFPGSYTRRKVILGAAAAGACFAAGGFGEASAVDTDTAVAVPPDSRFNVKLFGAKGDGKADDTKPIQAGIDAAIKAGGGCVYIPSGCYRVTKSLVFSSSERMDIIGDGYTSTLLHEANEPLLLWKEGIACRETSVRHLCISSAGNDKSVDVAAIACLGGAERSFFHHLLFNTAGAKMGSGIIVENVMDTTTFDHCLMWGPVAGTGIKVARGSEVRIFGGRIVGADPYKGVGEQNIGVHLVGNNGGVHIVTTDLIGLHTGIKIGQQGNASNREIFITHATFDSSVHGIRQVDNAYTSVAGCWSASSDEDQILLDDTAHRATLVVSGGTIFNGGAYGRPGKHNGIVVRAGSFILSGVSIRHNKGTGILVDSEHVRNYSITGCHIHNNGTGAVLNGDSFTFTGNVLYSNGTNLIDHGRANKQMLGNVVNK